MRFASPNDYGDAMLFVAGCTCNPKRVIQELDNNGAFLVEHYHSEECAKTTNRNLWHSRATGSVAADTTTTKDRYLRRLEFKEGRKPVSDLVAYREARTETGHGV